MTESRAKPWLSYTPVLFFFFLLTFFLYFSPLLPHLNTRVLGYLGDKSYIGYAVRTDPSGLFPSQPLLKLAIPLYRLFGDPLAYNLIVLAGFGLTFLFAYLFFRSFFSSLVASVLAVIFTFSPYHLYHSYNHLDLAQVWVVPLALWAVVRLEGRVGPSQGRTFAISKVRPFWGPTLFRLTWFQAIVVGLLLAATTLISNYYGYFLALTLAGLFLFRTVTTLLKAKLLIRPLLRRFRVYGVVGLVWVGSLGLVMFPFIKSNFLDTDQTHSPTVPVQVDETAKNRGLTDFIEFSARPWYFVLPSVAHPVLGQFSQRVYDRLAAGNYFLNDDFFEEEHAGLYLGWANLLLAGLGVLVLIRNTLRSECQMSKLKCQINDKFQIPKNFNQFLPISLREAEQYPISNIQYRRLKSWAVTFLSVGLILAFFSAPPFFTISGRIFYTPAWVLMKLFPMFRSLCRLGILILLCVLVLVGYALGFLRQILPKKPLAYYLLLTTYCFLALFDFYQPLRLADASTPPEIYTWLAAQPSGLVLERPEAALPPSLFWAKVHQHPIVQFGPAGMFATRVDMERFTANLLEGSASMSTLQDLGVQYLVFHRPASVGEFDEEVFWSSQPELSQIQDFGDVLVFEVL